MSKQLLVVLAGNLIGRVTQDRNRLRFAYEQAWRTAPHAIPLSLSIPLAATEHGHEAIHAFMWGLLPDNEQVLGRWGQHFHVSASNPFALLSHVGEDCAGAVQFVLPDRLNDVVSTGDARVVWLTESEVAQRLRTLSADHSRGRLVRDDGQFSLAGAQAKTALFFQDGRWGIPSGRTPTTHILKPPIAGLPGHVENEHFCLSLARELGFTVASSQVRTFEDQQVIVVERYDRYQTATLAASAASEAALAAAEAAAGDSSGAERAASATARSAALSELAKHQPVLRLHQEDLCQALGLLPTLKYQNEGGPSPRTIVDLLRTHSSQPQDDIATFVGALLFNWLIAGTDAHAKNYSLLLAARGQVRLAPLYDLGSALPYPDMDLRRLKLAMKLGNSYLIRNLTAQHVGQLGAALAIEPGWLLDQARDLAARLPAAIRKVTDDVKAAGLAEATMDRLAEAITTHVARCTKVL